MEKENRGRERKSWGGLRHEKGSRGEGKVCRCDRSREVGGGEEASGFLGERGAEEEDWRRDRRDEQARAQQRKGRLGVEGKQGASGRGKAGKRVSGRRQKQRERGIQKTAREGE